MNLEWTLVLDFAFLSLFLGMATYLKQAVKFFRTYLVPVSIIAGFVGLILGPEVLKIVPLDANRLGTIIYHLMAVGFIAMALKDRGRKNSGKEMFNTGAYIVSTYVLQGIIGFGLTLLLVYTVYPNLFPAFGLLLPLGYGQGPGQAFSIGSQWESQGFLFGGNIGLTIATLGFLWACIGGVPLMNYLIKRKKMPISRISGARNQTEAFTAPAQGEKIEPAEGESLDKLTVQFLLIGIVYLATYLSLKGITALLHPLGTFGQTFAQLLWGFHFIIASLYALVFRAILDLCLKKRIVTQTYTDNNLLQRISGGCFDYMIVASIAAISLAIVKQFIVPIALISTVGGFLTIAYTVYICKLIYKEHTLEYILALYGMLTGTISTGLALLREVDPELQTPAAENLMLGSGVGLFLGLPLMVLLNLPVFGYVTHQPLMYLWSMLALVVYFGVLVIVLYKNAPKDKGQINHQASQRNLPG